MTNLAVLQTKIAQLQNQVMNLPGAAANSPGLGVPMGSDILTKIESAVEAAVAKEMKGLEKLLETKLSLPSTTPAPGKKSLTLMEAIGLGLSPEEQLWLSKPEVLKAVPDFLASKEGQEFTKLFITDFRSSYGN